RTKRGPRSRCCGRPVGYRAVLDLRERALGDASDDVRGEAAGACGEAGVVGRGGVAATDRPQLAGPGVGGAVRYRLRDLYRNARERILRLVGRRLRAAVRADAPRGADV